MAAVAAAPLPSQYLLAARVSRRWPAPAASAGTLSAAPFAANAMHPPGPRRRERERQPDRRARSRDLFASAQGVTNPLAASATLAATGSAELLAVTKADARWPHAAVPGTSTTYTIVA